MPDNLERRGQQWHAVLMVPADVRPRLGRFKFSQALGTTDKRKADILKIPVIATWRAMVRRERGEGDALKNEALKIRTWLREMDIDIDNKPHAAPDFDDPAAAGDANREAVEDHAVERAEEIERTHGLAKAQEFAAIALGKAIPSDEHFDAWHTQLRDHAPKTQDQMRKDVSLLIKRFGTLEEITPKSVRRWVDELSQRGVSASSLERITSFSRSYWRYLQSPAVAAVPSDSNPFERLGIKRPKGGKNGASAGSWLPFQPEDVVSLWKAARTKQDTTLADLIMLGAYTGARIEELCSLKLDHVAPDHFRIIEGKTAAAVREVPIHSAIRPVVKRLKRNSRDGYLLSGLTSKNKYEQRSNGIGKRFGRLKTAAGFGEQHVFHSIRKTLVTLLENSGVSENLAADIVGHEKPRITYGLYSGGASLKTKAEAIECVRYPLGRGKIA